MFFMKKQVRGRILGIIITCATAGWVMETRAASRLDDHALTMPVGFPGRVLCG